MTCSLEDVQLSFVLRYLLHRRLERPTQARVQAAHQREKEVRAQTRPGFRGAFGGLRLHKRSDLVRDLSPLLATLLFFLYHRGRNR